MTSKFDAFTRENCRDEFKASESANDAENEYCSPGAGRPRVANRPRSRYYSVGL